MNLILHTLSGQTVAEFNAEAILVQQEQDAITLMEAMFESGARKLILHQKNLAPAFFDLSSGLAGAVLQKLTQYGMSVAIVGDFSIYPSQALKAFILESNRGKEVFFQDSLPAALAKLSAAS